MDKALRSKGKWDVTEMTSEFDVDLSSWLLKWLQVVQKALMCFDTQSSSNIYIPFQLQSKKSNKHHN